MFNTQNYMKQIKAVVGYWFLILCGVALAGRVMGQGTAFTYQGQLNGSGGPATGRYDFTFTLYATNVTGTPVAGPVTYAGTGVTNGLFTTLVDFGPGVFTGTSNWLEIAVRTNGAASFVTLAPRQQVTPTPYALVAGSVPGLTVQLNGSGTPNLIGGAANNTVGSGVVGATIAGGATNTIGQSASYTFLGGGNDNSVVNGANSFLGGGSGNAMNDSVNGVLVGGAGNQMVYDCQDSVLVGGLGNTVGFHGIASFLGGGEGNTVGSYAEFAFVGGGLSNVVNGIGGTVPGGAYNMAAGEYSFAAGEQAQALHNGAFVWADAEGVPFASTTTNQFNVRASGGVNLVTGGAGLVLDGVPIQTNGAGGLSLSSFTASGLVLPPGSGNVGLGLGALANPGSGVNITALGTEAMGNSSDPGSVAMGYQALQNDAAAGNGNSLSGNGDNTAVGFQSMAQDTTGWGNTALGYHSMSGEATNVDDTAVGAGAMSGCIQSEDTAVGGLALYNGSGAGGNTALGYQSLNNSSGGLNTACGTAALDRGSGSYNTATGYGAGLNLTGNNNTADGFEALSSGYPGNDNIAIGYRAGGNITGTNNIDIGNGGLATDSNTIRIGIPGAQTTTCIAGIYGETGLSGATLPVVVDAAGHLGTLPLTVFPTNVAVMGALKVDAVGTYGINPGTVYSNALTFGTGPAGSGEGIASKRVGANPYDLEFFTGFVNRMTILASGNVGIGTTNPAHLFQVGNATSPAYCDGTTWVNSSDRNAKEDFAMIDPRAVLAKVSALPITEWRYKVEADGTEHLGPMAQDFHAAFGLNGADDKHISTVDEGGVALAAIQGLNQKVEAKDAEIEALKQQNAALAAQLQALAAAVKTLAGHH